MKLDIQQTIKVPEGVTVELVNHKLIVKGTKGEVTKPLRVPRINFDVKKDEIIVSSDLASKREKKIVNTYRALIRNWIRGVQEGHSYKLKICSGHFPMTVSLKGEVLEIKNFIGEAVPRHLRIKSGAQVKIEGDSIEVSGHDKDVVGQVASDIEQLTRRTGFDHRIFQDGIYITDKDGKHIK